QRHTEIPAPQRQLQQGEAPDRHGIAVGGTGAAPARGRHDEAPDERREHEGGEDAGGDVAEPPPLGRGVDGERGSRALGRRLHRRQPRRRRDRGAVAPARPPAASGGPAATTRSAPARPSCARCRGRGPSGAPRRRGPRATPCARRRRRTSSRRLLGRTRVVHSSCSRRATVPPRGPRGGDPPPPAPARRPFSATGGAPHPRSPGASRLSCMSADENQPASSGPGGPRRPGARGDSNLPSWLVWVLVAVVGLTVVSALSLGSRPEEPISYTEFKEQVADGNVRDVVWNNVDQRITGTRTSGEEFVTTGPAELPADVLELMEDNDVRVEFSTPTPYFLTQLLPLMLPILLIIGFFVWMNRRAQG